MIDHVIIGWFSKISIHCRGSDEYAKVTLSWSIDGEGEFTRILLMFYRFRRLTIVGDFTSTQFCHHCR